jgi:hypothetical protein
MSKTYNDLFVNAMMDWVFLFWYVDNYLYEHDLFMKVFA